MNQTLIPNLKEVLRQKINEYMKSDEVTKYRFKRHEDDKFVFYNEVLEDVFMPHVDTFINSIIQNEIFNSVTEIIRISYIDDFNDTHKIEIECIEKNQTVHTGIKASFNIRGVLNPYLIPTVRLEISSTYMADLRKKRVPAVLFKDAGYYNDAHPTIIESEVFDSFFKKTSEYPIQDIFITIEDNLLTQELKESILHFINSDKEKAFFIEDPRGFNDHDTGAGLKGTKLFEIPDFDYTEDLERISEFPRLKYYKDCELFLEAFITFEISPDNYLEIYATKKGFEEIFVERIFDEYNSRWDIDDGRFVSDGRRHLHNSMVLIGSKNNRIPSMSGVWSEINKTQKKL